MQSKFIEIPANKRSLAMRRPVYGVGINDANYQITPIINGRQVMCPIYQAWSGMLERCYSGKYQAKKPTYIGCAVCNEWLTFSKFRAWMLKQDWQGKQIDKDIRVKGNKIYSAETCMFVTNKENSVEALARRYSFVSPSGEIVEIYNMTEFCRNNGLQQGNMSRVHTGKYKYHKDWTKA